MPDDLPDCQLCGDTGWITCVDLDGESAYETACPEGCVMATPGFRAWQADLDQEEAPVPP